MDGGRAKIALLQRLLPRSGTLCASGRRWSGPGRGTRPRPLCWRIPGLGSSTWTGAGRSWRSMTAPAASCDVARGCRTGDGVLRTRQPADQRRLERLVAGALPTPGPSGQRVDAAGPCGRGTAVCGACQTRRRAPTGLRRALRGRVGPDVEPRSQHRIDPGLVARTLGLTPMESRIAVGLAEGKSVREMAAATGRTPGAITWHLKQIYRRQSISGQVDLVRLVLSLTEFE